MHTYLPRAYFSLLPARTRVRRTTLLGRIAAAKAGGLDSVEVALTSAKA